MKFMRLFCSSSIVKFIPLLLLTVLATTLQAANLTSETETFSSDNVPGDRFGVAMAIASVEGNTMVIGAESADDIGESGVAYVFTRTGVGAAWNEVAKLTPSDGADNDFFGASVAISPDGGTIVIGAQGKLTYDDPLDVPDLGPAPTGIVYVYVKGAGAWVSADETVQLIPSDPFDNDRFGKGVAIGGGTDGDEIIAVGAESVEIANDNANGDGLIYVFDKPATGWAAWAAVATVPQVTPPTFTSAELARLRASDEGGFDHFHLGGSVAISEDGGVIVAGAYWWGETIGVDEDAGAAYVFVRPAAGTWLDSTETSFLQPLAPVLFEEMGRSIAIDKAGDTVVLGAPSPGGSTTGSVYVFTKPGAAWPDPGLVRETARLTASDGAVGDMFGNDVSISRGTAGDEKIVVGAPFTPYDNDAVPLPPAVEVGGAYVFNKPGGGAWVSATETDRLSADGLLPDDRFGFSVAIASTDTGNDGLLIGAPERDPGAAPAIPQDFQTGSFFNSFVADVDLSVAKSIQTGGPDFPVSTAVVFDLLVTNNSTTTNATGVTLVDTLPTELTYVSDTGTCINNAGTVTCDIGQILAGANTTISITATTAATVGTNITNTATVSGTEPDGTPANDSSSVSINITNAAPTASAVAITDANGGSAIVGDILNGTYTYDDAETDLEGTSTFRWLRGGVAIAGATADTYTTVGADGGQNISFEVTPVALTGTLTGTAVVSPIVAVLSNAAPTASNVTISDNNAGTIVVGVELTGSYTYADTENDTEGTSTFRWLRGGVAITGATSETYTLVADDSGEDITFEVTPVATTGTTTGTAVVSPAAVSVDNSAPTATGVSITDDNGGTAVVGDVLSGNYTFADIDNDTEGTSTFRWLRGGAAITGATADTYTLVADDSGEDITFEVTPVASAGTTTGAAAVSPTAISVANSAPTATSVAITDNNGGTIVVGVQLTGGYAYADPDNDAEGTSTFRWLRGGAPIGGATGNTYTLVAADSGEDITFEVTPVASAGILTGTAVVSPAAVSVDNSAPTATGVAITDNNSGTIVVGVQLTGEYTYADLDVDTEGTSTFRWLRGGVPIGGETSETYTLVADDSGEDITFEVTPVALTGTLNGIATISLTAVTVVNSAPTATPVTITDADGLPTEVGDILNGNYTYADLDNDAEGTSTFRWLRGGTPITGETTTSYTLVAADSGQSVTFEVTPVPVAGATATAVTSGGIVIGNAAPTATAVSITDANGGTVVVGDILNGVYTYDDLDNDTEGTSTFRWLRGGVAIAAATANTYTLVADDSGENISFEVTPVASAGTLTGNPVVSPTAVTVVNSAPSATAGNATVTEGDTVGIVLAGNDPDNDPLTFTVATQPSNGTLTGTAPNLVYEHDGSDTTTDSFTFTVNDGTAPESAAATVTITVTPQNDAPVANDGNATVDEDSSVAITLTGSDADGNAITYTLVTQPTNGFLDGTAPNLTYTHDGSETTSDSFTFTVNDGIVDSAVATVTITVTPQPDAPVANGGSVVMNVDEVMTVIELDGSDADGDAIEFSVIENPAHGTADLTDFSEVTYTPNPGFIGTDSFSFSVTETNGTLTGSATVLISVFPSGATLPTPTGNGWSFDITADTLTTLGLDASLEGEVVISSEAPLALVVNPAVNLAIFSGGDVTPADSDFNFPLGLFDFTVATTGTVEVMLQLPFGVDIPAGAVIRKLDNTDTWVTLAAPTAVIDAAAGVITLTLTDNDSNDRDPTVGIIRDPVGLAVAAPPAPPGGGSGGDDGGGSGGGSLGAILPLMFLLSMLQIIRQRRRYKV